MSKEKTKILIIRRVERKEFKVEVEWRVVKMMETYKYL